MPSISPSCSPDNILLIASAIDLLAEHMPGYSPIIQLQEELRELVERKVIHRKVENGKTS